MKPLDLKKHTHKVAGTGMEDIKGQILSRLLVAMQLQCSTKLSKQTYPFFKEASLTPPLQQNAEHTQLGWLHQGWNMGQDLILRLQFYVLGKKQQQQHSEEIQFLG